MTTIQTQGVHHITFVGSNRQAIIDFGLGWPQAAPDHFDDMSRRSILIVKASNMNCRSW